MPRVRRFLRRAFSTCPFSSGFSVWVRTPLGSLRDAAPSRTVPYLFVRARVPSPRPSRRTARHEPVRLLTAPLFEPLFPESGAKLRWPVRSGPGRPSPTEPGRSGPSPTEPDRGGPAPPLLPLPSSPLSPPPLLWLRPPTALATSADSVGYVRRLLRARRVLCAGRVLCARRRDRRPGGPRLAARALEVAIAHLQFVLLRT